MMRVMKRLTGLDCFTLDSAARTPTGSGLLDGIRIAVKDLIAIGGHTSSFGTRCWRETHDPAIADAPIVAKLRAAGGELVGTTKMDQLAYSLIGNVGEGNPPINVFDPESYCGGSSSGSASAVAADAADVGVGTDTAGSIRLPAAACGLFGFRPTHGRIGTAGVAPLAPSFDVVGFLARDPALLREVMTVVGAEFTAQSGPARILFPSDVWATQDPHDSAAAWAASERIADELDAENVDEPLGQFVDQAAGDLLARLQGREIWAQHERWVTDNAGVLAADVELRLQVCASLAADPSEVRQLDHDAHLRYVDELAKSIPTGTIAIVPVRPRRGPLRASTEADFSDFRRASFRLAAPSTLAGLPQLVLPAMHDSRYSPIGLVGVRHSDEALIELATALSSGNTEVQL